MVIRAAAAAAAKPLAAQPGYARAVALMQVAAGITASADALAVRIAAGPLSWRDPPPRRQCVRSRWGNCSRHRLADKFLVRAERSGRRHARPRCRPAAAGRVLHGVRPGGLATPRCGAPDYVTLELGGSAAVLVASDWCSPADLQRAAERVARFATHQAGQSCVAVQRVYADAWTQVALRADIIAAVERPGPGEPDDPATEVGPVINDRAADRVQAWVAEAVAAGAVIPTGGGRRAAGGTLPPNRPDRCRAREVPSYRADQAPYGGTRGSGIGREGRAAAMTDLTEERVPVQCAGSR